MGLQQVAGVVMHGFEVAHILRYLLPLLRNITALLTASHQGLDLHLAVHVREEILLRQILIMRSQLTAYAMWLLHVASGSCLLLGLLSAIWLL